ncbi:hypothetical protein UFOVP222_35 [uncultured Caudovirales phage]|uniref:Uncharacterized protein n=1 Tax=uncultured Caudovirales phage TaxID=2100421 RepID=A0A6J5TCJ5_9CAUD|nr:hypothetical protein UFOVP108_30 [uncultured Caudovirales phage]CAB5219178.1 hypothetical protein UFOVP222_35 [uncultured Caudovirales phage]
MSNDTNKANDNLVGSVDKVEDVAPSVAATPNGTIGTSETAPKLQPTADPKLNKKAKEKLVAVYSDNNRFWDDIGRLERGYNFIPQKQADAWLTQEGIRLATPEEVKANLPVGDDE